MPYKFFLDELAERIVNAKDKYRPYTRLKKRFLIHATTEDRLSSIKQKGLLPRGLAGCFVWSNERIPMGVNVEEVMICRENHVYFWDDLREGLQAIATVGYLKKGNPAVVIVDAEGIEDKLKIDPEVHRFGVDPEDPISLMYEGSIPPERILCTCTLDDDHKPDMGKVACPIMHEKGECPDYSVENLYDEFGDTAVWICECKNEFT